MELASNLVRKIRNTYSDFIDDETHIRRLPDEVLRHVLQHLPPDAIRNLALTSKFYYENDQVKLVYQRKIMQPNDQEVNHYEVPFLIRNLPPKAQHYLSITVLHFYVAKQELQFHFRHLMATISKFTNQATAPLVSTFINIRAVSEETFDHLSVIYGNNGTNRNFEIDYNDFNAEGMPFRWEDSILLQPESALLLTMRNSSAEHENHSSKDGVEDTVQANALK